jgi:transposase-like protein
VDETYVKAGGHRKYLFRVVDKHDRLIDFILMDRRNTRAANRFLGKALTTMRHGPPSSITTDQLGSYPKPLAGCNEKASYQAMPSIAPAHLQVSEQHH